MSYHCNISQWSESFQDPDLHQERHSSRAAWKWQSLLKYSRQLGLTCVLSSAFHFPPKLVMFYKSLKVEGAGGDHGRGWLWKAVVWGALSPTGEGSHESCLVLPAG